MPTARCAAQPSYFWSNAAGSRVYFDEMGPPWPKHPCTGSRQYAWGGSADSRPAYTTRPSPGMAALAGDFRRRFDAPPAQAYELEDVVWDGDAYCMHVRRVSWLRWRAVFVVPHAVAWVPGQLVFVAKERLSMLDPAMLRIVEFPAVAARPRR